MTNKNAKKSFSDENTPKIWGTSRPEVVWLKALDGDILAPLKIVGEQYTTYARQLPSRLISHSWPYRLITNVRLLPAVAYTLNAARAIDLLITKGNCNA